jgi:hypothetical protein
MKTRNIANVLDECLLRLHNGESAASCAARYPEFAADLAPMLALAQQLGRTATALSGLSEADRVITLDALRAASAARAAPRRGAWLARRVVPPWLALDLFLRPARTVLAAAGIATLLFATVSLSAIAASQPGSAIYPARVTLERGSVLLQRSPNSRVQAELRFADRRLAELEQYLAQTGLSAPYALNAMMAGDEAATARAGDLDREKRAALAARLAEHMAVLAGLAGSATEPETGRALLDASERASLMAEQIADGEFPRSRADVEDAVLDEQASDDESQRSLELRAAEPMDEQPAPDAAPPATPPDSSTPTEDQPALTAAEGER